MIVQETEDQKYRASIYDDLLESEIVGVDLNLDRDFFRSGMKMRIIQSMGTPDGTFPVDVAVDWIELSTN